MAYTSPTNLARRQSLINSLRQGPASGYQRGPLGALAQGLNAYTAASQGRQIDEAQAANESLRLKDMSQLVTNLRDETNTENLDATTTGVMLPPDIRPPIVSPPITHPAVKELELMQIYNQQLAQTKANRALANKGRFEDFYENGVLAGQVNTTTGEKNFYQPYTQDLKGQRTSENLDKKIKAQEDRAEENFKRRSALNLYNTGQEYNENNKLVDIVGATPYRTNTRNHADDVSELRSIQSTVQSAVDNIDEILSTKNESGFQDNFGGYTALASRLTPDILPTGYGGTTALNVKAKLEKLGSDMANSGLNTARAGGSIGQITEKEWPMLQKMIANITYSLSEDEARKQLKKVREKFVQFALNADEKYINTWDYGEQQYYNEGFTSKGMGLDFANKTKKHRPIIHQSKKINNSIPVVDDQFTEQEAAANAEANLSSTKEGQPTGKYTPEGLPIYKLPNGDFYVDRP